MSHYHQLVEEAKALVQTIYEKYENNPHMLVKTHSYIVTQLPVILENIRQTHEQRLLRIEAMTQDQDSFIESFLNNNQYFYVPQTETFFYYDSMNYAVISEDDVLYNILSSITKDRNLMSWKQKTRIHIMKRIRDNNSLFKTIPESYTIQYVLDSLCPSLFSSKNEAKYFLTILGDNILRKNANLIHYIPSKAKRLLMEMNNTCQMLVGQNLSNSFKHKFHDHDYTACRIVKINDSVKSDTIWKQIINDNMLNIICVACHYSVRYSSSDNYVSQFSDDESLMGTALYLKNMEKDDLVHMFLRDFMQIQYDEETEKPILPNVSTVTDMSMNRATQITWKNMQYLWKQFLESRNLPPVMFFQTLKTTLVEILAPIYNADSDVFIGICSKHLPAIQKFMYFWTETIVLDDTDFGLEIEEVVKLFRRWCFYNGETHSNLSDKQILDLIAYFYPTIEIDRDKYISGIRCGLWDKQLDIQVAIDSLKDIYKTKNRESSSFNKNISIYDAYIYYCKYYSNSSDIETVTSSFEKKLIVSKLYFEKYVVEYLADYLVDSKFLSANWYIL